MEKAVLTRKTRQVVTIRYIGKTCVCLMNKDKSIYKVITLGVPVRIGNQCSKFMPEWCDEDNLMHLRKYDRRGFILEDVYLPRDKTVLFAITSGAARRGLIHQYSGVDLNEQFESDGDNK